MNTMKWRNGRGRCALKLFPRPAIRRQRILSHKWSSPPINPARIEAALSALTGCPVTITENAAPYTFLVTVGETGNIYDFRQALKVLREIKPSHLSFTYRSHVKIEFTVTDCTGAFISELLREFFSEETVIITDVTDYAAGAGADRVREHMAEDAEPITTMETSYAAGAANERIQEAHTENG